MGLTQSWHSQEVKEVFSDLGGLQEGLSQEEVELRLHEVGYNRLETRKQFRKLKIFFSQLSNPLILLLCLAVGIKFYVNSYVDGSVILATLFLMLFISCFQEFRADHALQALQDLFSPKNFVLRGGRKVEVESEEIVPGDIILLEAGDQIPADARVFECISLKCDESPLTGESLPVEKGTAKNNEEEPLAERSSMVYTGTVVVAGKGKAIVCATGMQSEIGKIAQEMKSSTKCKTPLQKSIGKLSHVLLVVIACIVGVVFLMGAIHGIGWVELFLLGISIAVAAIPEGLPIVVTVLLAAGVRLLAKQHAIVRKLVAVETLGATQVICSDKTGTITKNEMELVKVSGFFGSDKDVTVRNYPQENLTEDERRLFEFLTLCNDAHLEGEDGKGDPTEIALLRGSKAVGIEKEALEKKYLRIDEIPFSSEQQYMATMHQGENKCFTTVKGSPERILSFATKVLVNHQEKEIDDSLRQDLINSFEELAQEGLRLLACGFKEGKEKNVEENLIFLGTVGLIDPPRQDAIQAIQACQKAGIDVMMITGDNPVTAHAIGKEIGLQSEKAVTGVDLHHVSENALPEIMDKEKVFARIEPGQKLMLVKALKKIGKIVAMTGDGVNDGPALEEADIGVAMGKNGTDLAREASDMILTDDNFATIVESVKEGRSIFNRLRNVTCFLLTTCFGELGAILLSLILTGQPPLQPIQILWINLITGAALAIPLGLEPKTGDELNYPPRDRDVGLIFRGMIYRIASLSLFIGLGSSLLFWLDGIKLGLAYGQTTVFVTIIISEWVLALNLRSDEKTLKELGTFNNRSILYSIVFSLALLLILIYVPSVSRLFQLTALNAREWALCLIPGFTIFLFEELRKRTFPKIFSHGKWKKNKTT